MSSGRWPKWLANANCSRSPIGSPFSASRIRPALTCVARARSLIERPLLILSSISRRFGMRRCCTVFAISDGILSDLRESVQLCAEMQLVARLRWAQMAGDDEWAKRIRAAGAYAGLGPGELAKRLGMSDSTLRRHLAAQKRPHEQRALWQTVAQITGLPEAFFTIDFALLENQPDALKERVDVLEQEVRRLANERGRPAPPGELGRRAGGSQPTVERPQQGETREEQDPQRDVGG